MNARAWSECSSLERAACASIWLNALKQLHRVCLDMELENEALRPTTEQYREAMQNAARAIATVGGSAA